MDHYTLLKDFDGTGAGFLVAGALAMNFHGLPRMTCRIELAAPPGDDARAAATAVLDRRGYRPAPGAPGEARRFLNREADLDEVIFLADPPRSFDELRRRSDRVLLHDLPLDVVSLDDLIAWAGHSRSDTAGDAAALRRLRDLLRERAAGGERTAAAAPGGEAERQMETFLTWAVERRCEWLLAGCRLRRRTEGGGGPVKGKAALRGRGRVTWGKTWEG